MLKPIFRFREWNLMRRDTLENLCGRAPCARGIRKFLEQTSTQHLQEALFVTLGITHCVQISSIRETPANDTDSVKLAALSRLLRLSCP